MGYADHVHPRWLAFWGVWGAQVFVSLATFNSTWMALVWVQFAVAEGWAATHKTEIKLPDGSKVLAGDTLSETSTWVSKFAKPASKWWQGWKGAISLFEIPLICGHFFITMGWDAEAGLRGFWPMLIVPTVGLYLWLIYHFVNATKHG